MRKVPYVSLNSIRIVLQEFDIMEHGAWQHEIEVLRSMLADAKEKAKKWEENCMRVVQDFYRFRASQSEPSSIGIPDWVLEAQVLLESGFHPAEDGSEAEVEATLLAGGEEFSESYNGPTQLLQEEISFSLE